MLIAGQKLAEQAANRTKLEILNPRRIWGLRPGERHAGSEHVCSSHESRVAGRRLETINAILRSHYHVVD